MGRLSYDLVKSLTTSEKVHFKRSAKTHAGSSNKNYLKIYDALENQKVYSKTALPALFEGTTISKYLSSETNVLNEKILLSLFNFNLNRSKRNKIQKGILIAEVLTSKGFKKDALKKVRVMKKNAWKQEEFTFILRLIELEEINLFKQGIIGYKDKLEELEQQRSMTTTKIRNLNSYKILRQEIRELQFDKHLLQEDSNKLKEFYQNQFVTNSNNCKSKRATENWYYVNVLTSYLEGNFKNGLSISSKYVNFIFENIHLFDSTVILPALSNYIYHAALCKNRNHFQIGAKLLIKLSEEKEQPKTYIKYILYTRNLEFGYQTKDVDVLKEFLASSISLIENNLEEFEEAQIQYLYLLIVQSTIILSQYELGMDYSNSWHQRGVLGYREVQARLFSIMLHYKLNYLKLIQSEIILLKKLAKKHWRKNELINAFYNFFNSIIKHPDRKNIYILEFQSKLKSILEHKKNEYSFDYYQWSLKL